MTENVQSKNIYTSYKSFIYHEFYKISISMDNNHAYSCVQLNMNTDENRGYIASLDVPDIQYMPVLHDQFLHCHFMSSERWL
jgi:hypothetical protein